MKAEQIAEAVWPAPIYQGQRDFAVRLVLARATQFCAVRYHGVTTSGIGTFTGPGQRGSRVGEDHPVESVIHGK
jgi:hypothetical protein